VTGARATWPMSPTTCTCASPTLPVAPSRTAEGHERSARINACANGCPLPHPSERASGAGTPGAIIQISRAGWSSRRSASSPAGGTLTCGGGRCPRLPRHRPEPRRHPRPCRQKPRLIVKPACAIHLVPHSPPLYTRPRRRWATVTRKSLHTTITTINTGRHYSKASSNSSISA